jgi:hypothetical protein
VGEGNDEIGKAMQSRDKFFGAAFAGWRRQMWYNQTI